LLFSGAGTAGQGDRPLSVKDEQQAIRQLVGTANQLSCHPLERLWRALEQLFRDIQYVADFIDQQADGAVLGVDDHVDRQLIGRPVGQFQAAAQVDGGDDLAAQVD